MPFARLRSCTSLSSSNQLSLSLTSATAVPPLLWEPRRMTDGAGDESVRDFFVSYTQADRAWAE